MKSWMVRGLTAVVLLFASACPAREVKVGYYRYGDYHGRSRDGVFSGFGHDVYELLAKKGGWTNVYVCADRPWSDMPKVIASGEAEIIDCVRKTPEREKIWEYSALPTGYTCGYIVVRKDETRYKPGDFANWGLVSFGSMAGGTVGAEFVEYALLRGFQAEKTDFRTEEDVLENLQSGRLDMAVVESTFYTDRKDFRVIGLINPQASYFCVKKGNRELMDAVDRAMSAIYEENPAWYSEIQRRHYKMEDVVVYLPRDHVREEVQSRYIRAVTHLLAAIGNWCPVFRECAADYSDADFSVPCVAAHVHRTPENLKKFDFPFVSVCRRPIYLVCAPKDVRFSDGLPKDAGTLRVGYDRTEPDWLKCFRDYAAHRNISYTLESFGSTVELRRALLASYVDLAVLGIDPKGELRRVEECGSVEFDFATPKVRPDLSRTLDLSVRYMRCHEGAFLRRLEKYAYGITDAGRVVRAGVYPEFGAIDIAEDGSISGLFADYLREVARHRNWDLIFVPMTCSEAFNCLAAGEVDIVPTSGRRPDPTGAYDLTRRDIGVLLYSLKVRNESGLLPNRPDLWTGNRIGYLSGSTTVDELGRYLNGIGAKHRLVPYTDLPSALADARAGKLDGIYTLHARESRDYRTVAVFPAVPSYVCVSRKRPELKRDLDETMDYFASNNVDVNWWFSSVHLRGSRDVLMLDAEEIAYVKRNRGRRVVVGLPENVDPISRFDPETGRASGFFAALFRDIAEKTGLEIEFAGKEHADVYVAQHESLDGRNDLIVDRDWYSIPTMRLSLPEERIPAEARGIWAVEAHRTDEIDYLRRNNRRPLVFDTREECYQAVVEGRAEATIDNVGTARLMIDEHRDFRDLRGSRIETSQWGRQTALGFSPDTPPQLRSILIKSCKAIGSATAEKMLVDAVVECRRDVFSREDLEYYGVFAVLLLVILLGAGYALMYAKKQQDAARARTKFFFNVSHDVRTPIHAIMGFIDIGLSCLDDRNKVKDCLIKAKGAGGLLLSLIKSVLDMSRIEAGKVKLEQTVGDVYLSFVDIESTLRELAEEKKIRLTFGFGEITDRFVYADYELCSRVFVNIITNAIKYTKEGGRIEVNCEQIEGPRSKVKGQTEGDVHCLTSDLSPRTSWYRYTFEDNGIGMSEKFQRHLYEKFSRETNTTLSGVSGLGLGMAICKTFVARLGGKIECRSKQGVGTTFTVTLPFRVQAGKKYVDPMTGAVRDKDEDRRVKVRGEGEGGAGSSVPLKSSPDFTGKKALLVDDSRLNREVARHYLLQAGFEVDTAENGREAVEKVVGEKSLRTPTQNSNYDVVLMDIQMPVMDGYEAARALRAAGVTIPIIAWTANAFDEDREAALAAGMNGHVAKGVKSSALLDALGRFCG